MTGAEALAAVRVAGAAGRFHLGGHSSRRGKQRNATRGDVKRALSNAHLCEDQQDGTWLVTGTDLDGDVLHMSVTISVDHMGAFVFVVTLF